MLTVLHWFTMALLIAGALALMAIVSPEKRFWKVATLGLMALFLPISYLAANDLLSRPKPMQHELLTQRLNEATVVASVIREQEDIYIWLAMKGLNEPRAYRLPWNPNRS